jgi:hypothetical protein
VTGRATRAKLVVVSKEEADEKRVGASSHTLCGALVFIMPSAALSLSLFRAAFDLPRSNTVRPPHPNTSAYHSLLEYEGAPPYSTVETPLFVRGRGIPTLGLEYAWQYPYLVGKPRRSSETVRRR